MTCINWQSLSKPEPAIFLKMNVISDNNSRCYVCDHVLLEEGSDVFTTCTENTKTPINELLEQFIGHSLTRTSSLNVCCAECMSRINDYDLACYTAHQVQKELTELLSSTNNKYSVKVGNAAGVVDGNESYDGGDVLSDSFADIIEEVDGDFEEAALPVKDENSGVVLPQNEIKTETLDTETDEFELQFFTANKALKEDIETYESDGNEVDYMCQVYTNSIKQFDPNEDEIETHQTDADASAERQVPNYCLQCERNFATKELLREHRRTVHKKPPKRHTCNICGMTYKIRNALRVHQLMHTGESPFKCEVCGKEFTQKGALKRHMPIHTGECRYQCEKCGKQFIHYSSFHMHNLAHDDIRKKKCEVCGLLLRSNSHLKRHLQVHTGAKPHKCPKCDKTFAQRYNMMTHLRSHQGLPRKRKHNCPVCDRTFTKEVSLQEHIATGFCRIEEATKMEIYQPMNSSVA